MGLLFHGKPSNWWLGAIVLFAAAAIVFALELWIWPTPQQAAVHVLGTGFAFMFGVPLVVIGVQTRVNPEPTDAHLTWLLFVAAGVVVSAGCFALNFVID